MHLHIQQDKIVRKFPDLGTVIGTLALSGEEIVGIDFEFEPVASDTLLPGRMRYAPAITRTGKVRWDFISSTGPNSKEHDPLEPPLTERTQTDFPAQAVHAMRYVCDTLHTYCPTNWFALVLTVIQFELQGIAGASEGASRLVENYSLLLSSREPDQRQSFVHKAGCRCGCRDRVTVTGPTPQRRAGWATGLHTAEARVEAITGRYAARKALLERLEHSLSEWARFQTSSANPYQTYLTALAA